jgi:ABC-type bacteriocin/lantibiotic exporter with double-glycine peptidase domain
MLALNALATAVLVPLSNLVGTAGQLQQMTSYLERLRDVLETPPERPRDKVGHAPTLTGACELEQVCFRYSTDAPLVLQDVSVRIEPGKMVAIVGRSGAGKSTLANLLLGLYLPTSGQVRYDGVNLADLDLQAVRSQMGVVLQNPAFFGSTLRANITLDDPNIPTEAVVEAARLAQIHDDSCPCRSTTTPRWPARPARCRAGSGSGWGWPGRWCASPSCCCWMRRRARWTR